MDILNLLFVFRVCHIIVRQAANYTLSIYELLNLPIVSHEKGSTIFSTWQTGKGNFGLVLQSLFQSCFRFLGAVQWLKRLGRLGKAILVLIFGP